MKNLPWRMILLLILIVLVTLFSGFNLNPVDISVGFYVFEGVPLFLALIASFIVGVVVMMPIVFLRRREASLSQTTGQKNDRSGKRRKRKTERKVEAERDLPAEQAHN